MNIFKPLSILVCGFTLLAVIVCPAFADDKNGVSPNTISLPSGPGSVEGMGGSFQPLLNTGMASYEVKIAVTPGVNGHTPQLALKYNSGNGHGIAGIGWETGPGSIKRQTEKGIPRYVDAPNSIDDDHDGGIDELDEIDRIVGPDGEELVKVDDNSYRARIEGSFVLYRRTGNHWEAYLKNGTKLEFGITTSARVTDNAGDRIYKWLLEKSTDSNGNVIQYFYTGFAGSDNHKYLKEVRYGPGNGLWTAFYFVSFSYEDRPDWRKDYRSGFLIKTTRRLAQINVGVEGIVTPGLMVGDWNNNGTQDALIRRYTLSYDDTSSYLSFLSGITQFGADGTNYLPPISFSYAIFDPDTVVSATGSVSGSINEPLTVMDNTSVELVDLNSDSLPDILNTGQGGIHLAHINLGMHGEPGNLELMWDDVQEVVGEDSYSTQKSLSNSCVHLADMNGDGISDLVYSSPFGDVYYYQNRKSPAWGAQQLMSIQDTPPPAPFNNTNVRNTDIDFDKRIDVVKSTENGYYTWFNIEEGVYSNSVYTDGAVHQGHNLLFSDDRVRLADMNGDRMNDVVKIKNVEVIYCANMGHGNFDSSIVIPIPDWTLTDDQAKKAQLEDINGDGLSDLVIERATISELWYWLNLGTNAFSNRHIITDMPASYSSTMVTRWADINGNGTTDLIYADSTVTPKLRIVDIGELVGGGNHANLLNHIDNGLGVSTKIIYKSSTDYYLNALNEGTLWDTTIPFPVSVVGRVETSTGLDLDGIPGEDQYVKEFIYRDGYYDDNEKAFRGFSEVRVIEHGDTSFPALHTVHNFHTGGPDGRDNDGDEQTDEISEAGFREEDALKGLPLETEIRSEDDFVFNRETNAWQIGTLLEGIDGIEVRYAYNQETNKWIYEGTDTPETIKVTYLYDNYGNVREEKNYGALSIVGDEVFTYTQYINDIDKWILGKPLRRYTTDGIDLKVSEEKHYYDGTPYVGLGYGLLEKGNLTRQEGWVAESTYVNLVRNAYDSYGNIVGIMDGNGNLREIEYDATLHTFPIKETIHIGGASPPIMVTAECNAGFGVVTQSTNFNGHTTNYDYDSFGRLVKIIKPGDSSAFPTQHFTYTMADPERGLIYSYDEDGNLTLLNAQATASSVETKIREEFGQPGTFDSIHYTDGLGRKLALLEEAEQGFVVKDAVLFNARGTTRYAFLPHGVASSDYQVPALIGHKVETHYDTTGREVLRINPPDQNGTVTQASTQYLPLENIATDENNNSKTFINDGLERLIKVHEENKGETYITRYEFDPLGSLTKITDAQNNVKTMIYDGLKRKIEMDDPDCGHKSYEYDDAGNLIRTIDNKSQIIQYLYDGANRILAEDYLDEAGITPDVAYYYDASSQDYPDAVNVKGAISWVEDLSGTQFFSYDERGNTAWTIKRVHDGDFFGDYKTAMTYDAMDRVVSMTYPDSDQVSYTYNSRTLLESIPDFVDGMDYHASGQIASIDYANDIETSYSYDPRQRLINLSTKNISQGNEVVQNLSYTLDGVSNITAIADGRGLPPNSPKNAGQIFEYDNLYRLTQADGPGYGRINFQYDKIGNMIWKKSPDAPDPKHIDDALINLGNMDYGSDSGSSNRSGRSPGDPPGPHAVTNTESGLLYDYDDNGNMISHANGDIYSWDFRDRLIRVQKGDTDTHYVYDYGGQRVIKKVNDGGEEKITLYISEGYEIREGNAIKYVFGGGRRVARVEGRLPDTGESTYQTLNFQPGWNFFSLEVEPENTAIGEVLGSIEGDFSEVWTFDALQNEYKGYVPGEGVDDLTEIHAQKGYLIKVVSQATLFVSGTRINDDINITTGWNLVGCPANADLPIEEALASIDGKFVSVWYYEAIDGQWKFFNPEQPDFLNDLLSMEPRRAYWIEMKTNDQLAYVGKPAKIHFYHLDHLGSSNLIMNMEGSEVESTEFYPFGRPRYEERNDFDSAYKYTGKELDKESGLVYYGARYYEPVVGRFVSVDPLYVELDNFERERLKRFLSDTQQVNVYRYAGNNPLKFIDLNGLEDSDPNLDGAIFYDQGEESDKAHTLLDSIIESTPLGILSDLRKYDGPKELHEIDPEGFVEDFFSIAQKLLLLPDNPAVDVSKKIIAKASVAVAGSIAKEINDITWGPGTPAGITTEELNKRGNRNTLLINQREDLKNIQNNQNEGRYGHPWNKNKKRE